MESFGRILIRAPNWVGDAILSLPAVQAVRERFPGAHIAILARPWVAGVYNSCDSANQIILYKKCSGLPGVRERLRVASGLRRERFDCAVLLQNAFDAAIVAALALIPVRIGYARDARGWLLTRPVPVPRRGEIPRHESYYYLELLRRAGWLDALPASPEPRLSRIRRQPEPLIGVSPGAAFGSAKRWLPERFAAAAAAIARQCAASVSVFGSASERELCQKVAAEIEACGVEVRNRAGATSLEEFIHLAARCLLFLTNDSGAMHVAAALGVPTVAVFGATDPEATAPLGPRVRLVREPVDCSPCFLRECPIDHRCMTRVHADRVVAAALDLLSAS